MSNVICPKRQLSNVGILTNRDRSLAFKETLTTFFDGGSTDLGKQYALPGSGHGEFNDYESPDERNDCVQSSSSKELRDVDR
ncbi:MAG: hypothetical protein O3B86_10140 [Planctomycetota bacterium]|nr:hypothetical protein [Planctomycetota bacterium]